MNRVSRLALGLALAAWPLSALAQSTTIVADVGAARGLGTTVTGAGSGVTIDGGTLSGANLFHSFSQFSLGAGATARWTRNSGNAAAVTNVINRVTGGQVSQIAGTIDSTGLPNATFFFINPAGIVFGSGARVNVPAAAFFSTAGEMRFADGARFAVATPNGSTLSVAAPESFGFLGGQGDIVVDSAGSTFGSSANVLSLSAANVGVANAKLTLRGLDLVAVGAGAATLRLADPLASVAGALDVRGSQIVGTTESGLAAPLRFGGADVTFDSSLLISDAGAAAAGGGVRIVADRLSSTATTVGASARGSGQGGEIAIRAKDVRIDGGLLFTISSGDGPGGRFSLLAGTIGLTNGASLSTLSSGAGRAGDIDITATTSLTADPGYIGSNATASGDGGSVRVSAPNLELINATVTAGASGSGQSGDVFLSGDLIDISGGAYGSVPGLNSTTGNLTVNATSRLTGFGMTFTVANYSDRPAGSIFVRAPEISIERGVFTSDAFGDGDAGAVMIDAGKLFFLDTNVKAESRGSIPTAALGLVQITSTGDLTLFNSFVTSNATRVADGGKIVIQGKDVRIEQGYVSADTEGSSQGSFGNAGNVFVTADTLLVTNARVTSTAALGTSGNAGSLNIVVAKTLTLDTQSKIGSDAQDTGNAGTVAIKTGTLEIKDFSSITSQSTSGTGDAGTVRIDANSILVSDNGFISSGTNTSGQGGDVFIKTGTLTVDGAGTLFAYIDSETLGAGNAGHVFVEAKTIDLKNGGFLSSNTFSDGSAGGVSVKADTLTLSGGASISSESQGLGDAGDVTIMTTGTLKVIGNPDDPMFPTYISSDTFGPGRAGELTIDAKSVIVQAGGFISSDGVAGGDAGNIIVRADTVSLSDFGGISSATFSSGQGGDVSIIAKSLMLTGGGYISSEGTRNATGDAGMVNLTVDALTIGKGSAITTASSGAGNAGTVTIGAKTLTVDGGLISSAANLGSTGLARSLSINADAVAVLNGGSISTVSFNPGRAGEIQVKAGSILIDGDKSMISSENQAGNVKLGSPAGPGGDAGTLRLASNAITVTNGGRISTNSFGGSAGDIFIAMSQDALLTLAGTDAPGAITTSSGRGSGGRIIIAQPRAVISNGGSILALGERKSANVVIDSRYFISSTDRANVVAVDGEFKLAAGAYDVSSGTVTVDLSVLDASKVLRGQCPAARSTGAVSQLITRSVGPYAREVAAEPAQRPAAQLGLSVGACR